MKRLAILVALVTGALAPAAAPRRLDRRRRRAEPQHAGRC